MADPRRGLRGRLRRAGCNDICQAGQVSPKRQYLLIALLVAWTVALAIASGFGLRAVVVTGLILAGVFAVVACVQLARRRRG